MKTATKTTRTLKVLHGPADLTGTMGLLTRHKMWVQLTITRGSKTTVDQYEVTRTDGDDVGEVYIWKKADGETYYVTRGQSDCSCPAGQLDKPCKHKAASAKIEGMHF